MYGYIIAALLILFRPKVNLGGKSMSDAGLEPATPCLQVRFSTNWADQADSPANHHTPLPLDF